MPKKYTGIIKLGETTPSYDRETEVDRTYEYNHIDKNAVLNIAKSFIGKQKQIPPIFSALKKDGKRLYSYAREKINIEIKPREIEIFNFEIINFSSPYVEFLINCSKGTYIRSIANDYGKKLKSGSYLYELKRISIGDLLVDEAIRFEQI